MNQDATIVALGSAVLEVREDGAVSAGGTALNVAVGARRLGAHARLVAAVADDPPGRALLDAAQAEGVPCSPAAGGRATVTAQLRRAGTSMQYSFSSPVPSGTLTLDAHHLRLVERADVLVISGARADGIEGLERLARTLAGRSGLTIYDPNPRPRGPADARAQRREVERLAPECDLLKVSDEDCDLLFGAAGPAAADRFLERGTGAVLITHGPEGAEIATVDGRATCFSLVDPESVVDPTGAGDAMTAALAWWLTWHGRPRDLADLESALIVAQAAAALACLRIGSASALPRADDLARALNSTLDRATLHTPAQT